eukprot:scaffold609_cov170-Amphora_coffeaeformis.AAC.30
MPRVRFQSILLLTGFLLLMFSSFAAPQRRLRAHRPPGRDATLDSHDVPRARASLPGLVNIVDPPRRVPIGFVPWFRAVVDPATSGRYDVHQWPS